MTDPVHSVNIFFMVGFVAVTVTTITILLEHTNND